MYDKNKRDSKFGQAQKRVQEWTNNDQLTLHMVFVAHKNHNSDKLRDE